METFKASAQYNDLKGSAVADYAHETDATKWLKDNGRITNESLIGLSMSASENDETHIGTVSVKFLVTDKKIKEILQASEEPVRVEEIVVEMNISDFFALFKRLTITLSNEGKFEGKTYISD